MRARFFGLVAVVLGLDLATKAWAVRSLAEAPIPLVPGRVGFVLAHNTHAAMGFLHQVPGDARRALLVAIAVLASVWIVLLARRTQPSERALRSGLALILGGALGNVIDRAWSGAVVDFIDVVYWTTSDGMARHWPTFNVADVAIVVGAALAALGSYRSPEGSPLRAPFARG